jgi:DNA-binding CsgD family transcriptional regulator
MSHHGAAPAPGQGLDGEGAAGGTVARLFGRDRERSLLAGLLGRLPPRGGALVLRGPPGIGKSALLDEAGRVATARAIPVLRTSGVPSEAGLAFAGLHQLLRPVLGDAAGLPPALRAALGAAFGTVEAPAPGSSLVAVATLRLLSAAAPGPVVLAAEDAQSLDRPTAEVLAFIGRGAGSHPVLLLAAIRDGYQSPLLDDGLSRLYLKGLGARPARELLDTRSPGLSPAARGRVLAAARGNPLALTELPAALAGPESATTPEHPPLTRRLEQALAARAAELPPAARTLLLVAAADASTSLGQVMKAAAVASGTEPTAGDLISLAEAGLIAPAGHAVRFLDPLVRSAVYRAASVADRHAAHAALAEVLADDPDRQAWHRAAVAPGPDSDVAADLERAARRARRRGGIPAAAAGFERAAAFTADPARRGALLLSAAEAARELGRPELVGRLLREADTAPLTPRDRACALWLGDALSDQPTGDRFRIRALTQTAARTATAGDTKLALRLLAAAVSRCHWAGLAGEEVSDILRAADDVGAPPGDPLLRHIQAYAAPVARGPAAGASPAGAGDPESLYWLGAAAYLDGDYHVACSLLGACAARLREQGRLHLLAHALAVRAWASIMISDYRAAGPAAAEAAGLAAETAQPLWEANAWGAQAALAALSGDSDAVDRLTARVEEVMLPAGAAAPLSRVQYVRGLAALGQGQHADAWAHLHRIYEPGDPASNDRTMGSAIADLAEAAVRSGHRDHARRVLARLRPRLRQAPWLRAAAACAEALLADDDRAEAAYGTALAGDLTPWPLARARLDLAYGEWLRRQRRPADSRTHLRAARDSFDALGATPWGEHARRELRASGDDSRPRAAGPVAQLTPQELQITRLAAEGLSNREIGQRLYLSHRTVESHLYRVYPKLGITSRAQLRGALSRLP